MRLLTYAFGVLVVPVAVFCALVESLPTTLDDNITSFGVRSDQAATQERRTLRARYQLVDLRNGLVVLDSTAGSDAGIDIVSSEYATVAAEQTALENLADIVADQITARVALYASRTAPRQVQPK